MKTLGLIPARGGSKGVPRKNIREICGKPLIAWTIEAALAAKGLDRVVVSTEDEEIAAVARRYGADVLLRPPELATDTASTQDVMVHALQNLPAETLVLLQPTSPYRTNGSSTVASRRSIRAATIHSRQASSATTRNMARTRCRVSRSRGSFMTMATSTSSAPRTSLRATATASASDAISRIVTRTRRLMTRLTSGCSNRF